MMAKFSIFFPTKFVFQAKCFEFYVPLHSARRCLLGPWMPYHTLALSDSYMHAARQWKQSLENCLY